MVAEAKGVPAPQVIHHLAKTLCPDVPSDLKERGAALRKLFGSRDSRDAMTDLAEDYQPAPRVASAAR